MCSGCFGRLRRFLKHAGPSCNLSRGSLELPCGIAADPWAQADSADYRSLPAFRIDSGRVPLMCPRGRDPKALVSRVGWRRPWIPTCHLLRAPALASCATTPHRPARQPPTCRTRGFRRDFATRVTKVHAHIGGSRRSIATGCKNGMEAITRKMSRMVPDLPDGSPASLSISQL